MYGQMQSKTTQHATTETHLLESATHHAFLVNEQVNSPLKGFVSEAINRLMVRKEFRTF